MRILISREPWWAKPPLDGQDELTVDWGFLEIYRLGSKFEFDYVDERPTDLEIHNRKGCRLAGQ